MTVETAPICPRHNKAMREGKFGWYCPSKEQDGSWCKEKAPAPAKPAAATPAAGPSASAAPAVNGDGGARLALAVACLEMAARTCAGDEQADPVAVAERAFDAMWARVQP